MVDIKAHLPPCGVNDGYLTEADNFQKIAAVRRRLGFAQSTLCITKYPDGPIW
jgi:hypothetical protein